MEQEDPRVAKIVERLRNGDSEALAELFALNRDRLGRLVELRLDPRLKGRVSGSDILQESYIAALKRLPHFLQKPSLPAHVWLRMITCQRIIDAQREHLGAQMRDAGRDVSMHASPYPAASSVNIAACLVAHLESPSQVAMRREALAQLESAIESMDPIDREVLALRHFEELCNDDVAEILGLQKAAASNRYVRALKRLREAMAKLGGMSGPLP